MKKHNIITKYIFLIFTIVFLTPFLSKAQIEISGFFDLQYNQQLNSDEKSNLNFGQFEIGLSKSLKDYINIEAAIALNNESHQFELGSGIIDFKLLGKEGHKIKSNVLNESGIIVGQFDVPFGIDYECFPSPDRKLVSVPLANEKILNCWNNYGIDLYGATDNINVTLFGLSGFSEGVTLGGRVGFLPFDEAELGVSYMNDFKKFNENQAEAFGLDMKIEIHELEIKGEYISAHGLLDGEINDLIGSNTGYYLQVDKNLNEQFNIPLFVVLRYGAWHSGNEMNSNQEVGKINRVTLCVGTEIYENTEIRLEYMAQKIKNENNNNLLTAQLVVSF